jgi:hypothetical protein
VIDLVEGKGQMAQDRQKVLRALFSQIAFATIEIIIFVVVRCMWPTLDASRRRVRCSTSQATSECFIAADFDAHIAFRLLCAILYCVTKLLTRPDWTLRSTPRVNLTQANPRRPLHVRITHIHTHTHTHTHTQATCVQAGKRGRD